MKKVVAFVKKHPAYHATLHGLGGIGVGLMIASPLAGLHPVRWGIVLLMVSLLGHLYALVA